jgi:hypothetical protein
MIVTRTLLVSFIALLLCASNLEAQQRQEHIFFWLSLGAGAGVNVSDELEGERSLGGAGYLRVGGAITQRVLIGVEFLAWARRHEAEAVVDPFTMQRSNASILLMFYPSDMGGLFLKAGASGAWIDIEESGTKVREQGTGARAGIGYDIRLGHLYLTPNLDWMFQTFEAAPGANTTNHMALATLGITWH